MGNFQAPQLEEIKYDIPKEVPTQSTGASASAGASTFGTTHTRLNNTELQKVLDNYSMMTIGGKEFFSSDKPLRDSMKEFYKDSYDSAVNIQLFSFLDYITTGNPESMKTYSMAEDRIQNSKRNLVKFNWADTVLSNKDNRSADEVQVASAIMWQGMSAYKLGEEMVSQTGAAGQLSASEAAMVQAGVYGNSASAGTGNSDIQAALEKVQQEELYKWMELHNKVTDPKEKQAVEAAMKHQLGRGITNDIFKTQGGIKSN